MGVPFDSLRSLRAGSSTALPAVTPLRMTNLEIYRGELAEAARKISAAAMIVLVWMVTVSSTRMA